MDPNDKFWFHWRGGKSMMRSNILGPSAILCLATLLSACGDSEKKLGAAERRQKELEAENTELKLQSDSLLNGLKRAVAGDNAVWVLANVDANYTDAKATCSKMSYDLPTESNLADLKQRDSESPANKLVQSLVTESSGRFAQIHIVDKTVDLAKGVVICRKSDSDQSIK